MRLAAMPIRTLLTTALVLLARPAAAIECTGCPPLYCANDPAFPDALAAKKAALLARGYPDRLVRLLDRDGRCLGCLEAAPMGFSIEVVTADGARMTFAWTRARERQARKDLRKGRIKSFHLMNVAKACACCGEPEAEQRPDWRSDLEVNGDLVQSFASARDLGPEPPDLAETPRTGTAGEAPPPAPRPEIVPTPPVQAVCHVCPPIAQARNEVAAQLDELRRNQRRLTDELGAAEELAGQAYETGLPAPTDDSKAARAARDKLKERAAQVAAARATLDRNRAEVRASRTRLGESDRQLAECERTACGPRTPETEGRALPPPIHGRVSIGLGPSLGRHIDHQLAAGAQVAVRVTRDERGFVVLSPSVGVFNDFTIVMVPIGFEYGFTLPKLPALSVYGRVSFGYAVRVFGAPTQVFHAGLFLPEAGARWHFGRRFFVAFEPFGFPVVFDGTNTRFWYRLMAYAGLDF